MNNWIPDMFGASVTRRSSSIKITASGTVPQIVIKNRGGDADASGGNATGGGTGGQGGTANGGHNIIGLPEDILKHFNNGGGGAPSTPGGAPTPPMGTPAVPSGGSGGGGSSSGGLNVTPIAPLPSGGSGGGGGAPATPATPTTPTTKRRWWQPNKPNATPAAPPSGGSTPSGAPGGSGSAPLPPVIPTAPGGSRSSLPAGQTFPLPGGAAPSTTSKPSRMSPPTTSTTGPVSAPAKPSSSGAGASPIRDTDGPVDVTPKPRSIKEQVGNAAALGGEFGLEVAKQQAKTAPAEAAIAALPVAGEAIDAGISAGDVGIAAVKTVIKHPKRVKQVGTDVSTDVKALWHKIRRRNSSVDWEERYATNNEKRSRFCSCGSTAVGVDDDGYSACKSHSVKLPPEGSEGFPDEGKPSW